MRRSFDLLGVDATQDVRESTDVKLQSEERVRGRTHVGPLKEVKEVTSEAEFPRNVGGKTGRRDEVASLPSYSQRYRAYLTGHDRFVIRGPGPRF